MEIERKFLVIREEWEQLQKPQPSRIMQGYLVTEENCTVRVRTKGEKAFLTVKGKTSGISRSEYEYEIPIKEAESMLTEFCPKVLSKDRYEISYQGHLWEVDVFHGKLSPLILAEVELSSEKEKVMLPSWAGVEVSLDPEYYNARLIGKL